jgi:hypothetical protein
MFFIVWFNPAPLMSAIQLTLGPGGNNKGLLIMNFTLTIASISGGIS